MNATMTRKASGSVRWISRIAENKVNGRVQITSQTKAGPVTKDYDVYVLRQDEEGRVVNVRLMDDGGRVYHVDLISSYCDCMDHYCRGSECKHARGMRAAVAHLNLL